MTTESTVPLLPCRSLDESLAFYGLLGFEVTFRQKRPNPCASITRGGIDIFLFEIDGFVPENSYGSILIITSDTEGLFAAFAEGLRAGLGKLPVAGIPRITRPRLQRVVENAARQGDAHGDDAAAIAVLDAGLARYAEAPLVERVPALVYRSELDLRVGNVERARETLERVTSLRLSGTVAADLHKDLEAAKVILGDI